MNFSKEIRDLGLLSELAYLRLEDEFFSSKDYSREKIENFFKTKKTEEGEYENTGVDNSTTSMLAILDKYDIKHFKPFSSDLQLMVLEDKNYTQNYTPEVESPLLK